jgi:XTP/dITP diphosphohydrolase
MTDRDGVDYLRETMATLRGEGGCLWDREQTHQSLVPYLIEETAELVDAIETGTRKSVVEELGDVFYQVAFHADILSDDPHQPVTLDDVARATAEKMRTRHPHVFGEVTVSDVSEIRDNWIKQKQAEHGRPKSVVDQVPSSLHPIARAQALIHRAERHGLDIGTSSATASGEELGEAMLGLIHRAESQGINADHALREAIRRLERTIADQENQSE